MFFQKYKVDPLYGTLAYEGIADNTERSRNPLTALIVCSIIIRMTVQIG